MSGSGKEGGTGPLGNAVLIAGPTASGKSTLALEAARRSGGAIVNADSMQVYGVLRVLTARPGEDELQAAPHHLYGHVHPSISYSTGAWLRDAAALASSGALEGRRPIFVGGTGLYFRALTGGIAEMPPIDPDLRERWRGALAELGPQDLHRQLLERDPEAAARLNPADGPRIARALEVLDQTGRPIGEWQAQRGQPLVDPASATPIVIEPDRAWLEARIRERLEAMVRQGASDEVKALLALKLDPSLPAMKAIGVAELRDVIEGGLPVSEAVDRATIATRRYAKRQATWFRNQMGPEWRRASSADAASMTLFNSL